MPPLKREIRNDRFSSVQTVFSNIDLVYIPSNTEEKATGTCKYMKPISNSRIPSLNLFHPRKYTVSQAKETPRLPLLLVYYKPEGDRISQDH